MSICTVCHLKSLDTQWERTAEKITPFTITSRDELLEEIQMVRRRGVATAVGELDENENGISAPIFDKRNNLIAFISVCGPSFRFTKEKMLTLSDRIIGAAREIEKYLN